MILVGISNLYRYLNLNIKSFSRPLLLGKLLLALPKKLPDIRGSLLTVAILMVSLLYLALKNMETNISYLILITRMNKCANRAKVIMGKIYKLHEHLRIL